MSSLLLFIEASEWTEYGRVSADLLLVLGIAIAVPPGILVFSPFAAAALCIALAMRLQDLPRDPGDQGSPSTTPDWFLFRKRKDGVQTLAGSEVFT